jgi:hypothetical protein
MKQQTRYKDDTTVDNEEVPETVPQQEVDEVVGPQREAVREQYPRPTAPGLRGGCRQP